MMTGRTGGSLVLKENTTKNFVKKHLIVCIFGRIIIYNCCILSTFRIKIRNIELFNHIELFVTSII